MMRDLKAGIYRHYKGPLYQVFGLAHDANADTLANWVEGPFPVEPLEERTVVVYIGLQLDDAHTGPRLAVRTYDDFSAWVHDDGSVCEHRLYDNATVTCRQTKRDIVQRFTYLGPEWNG